jgi:starch synthase
LPRYASIEPSPTAKRERKTVRVQRGDRQLAATVYRQAVRGVPFFLIDGEPVARGPDVYGGGPLEGEKFCFWCLAALRACEAQRWAPDIVHANDWHAAAAVAWLSAHRGADPFWARTATVLTVHNLGYAGAGAEPAWTDYGLPPAAGPDVPEWARQLPLASALERADLVTTVSPTYAEDITTPESGFGLEPILLARPTRPLGILNGIDPTVWNPSADRAIEARFGTDNLDRREVNKRSLLGELGFEEDARTPLLAFIGRLEPQKGIDLLLQALATLLDRPWQAAVLGTGQPELEAMAASFEEGHPGRFRYRPVFDEPWSRRLYASADMILVPSRYEPCGLVQMIGMRYGCVPIVRATGGLRDTVRDQSAGGGTGVLFAEPTSEALAGALRRAFDLYADQRAWRGLQRRAANRDFSWEGSARRYVTAYRQAVRARRSLPL